MVFGTLSVIYYTFLLCSYSWAECIFFFPALFGFLSLLWLLWGCNVFSCPVCRPPQSPPPFMYWFGRKITVRARLCSQVTVRGVGNIHFLPGLFPPAYSCSVIHLSKLQDLKPAIHLPDFGNFTVLQLDWCMTPLLLPRWVMFHVLRGGSREQ